jgi:hypothetical protein
VAGALLFYRAFWYLFSAYHDMDPSYATLYLVQKIKTGSFVAMGHRPAA